MRCFIGIDLGSTTTKAVVIDEDQNVIGRGITNSRSNYDTAATVAKTEALINGRFHLFRQALARTGALNGDLDTFIGQLERDFRAEQYLEQLVDLEETCRRSLETANFGSDAGVVREALDEVFKRVTVEAPALFAPGAKRKSDGSAVTYILVNAIQEQQAIIDAQQAEIDALQAQVAEIDQLKVQMAQLSRMMAELNAEKAEATTPTRTTDRD